VTQLLRHPTGRSPRTVQIMYGTARRTVQYLSAVQSITTSLSTKNQCPRFAALHHWGVRVPWNSTGKHTLVKDLLGLVLVLISFIFKRKFKNRQSLVCV
jgi:hypothetical protein